MSIPLYQYQIESTDCLREAILDNDFEVKVKGPRLISKCRSFYLTSPLGSGKTRMAARTIKSLVESDAFEEKVFSFDIGKKSAVLKTSSKSKILIIVPVSVAPQWQKELDLWDIKYHAMITPKNIKPVNEIEEKVILLTDYRTKDSLTYLVSDDYQFYVFIDEYDTCSIQKAFVEKIFSCVKSKVCISANYDGKDYFPVPHDKIDLCRIIISDNVVKSNIKLPDPIEKVFKISLCSILTKNFEDLGSTVTSNIRHGNLSYIFSSYGLTSDSTIDKLFSRIIKDKRKMIEDHCVKVGVKSDAYTKKLTEQCERLEQSLKDHWKVCDECKDDIPTLKDATNCLSCYGFFCRKCSLSFKNDNCSVCYSVSNGGSIPGDGTSFVFKNRVQCLGKILENIRSRKSGSSVISEPSKKVLVYCSYPNLVTVLNEYLEKNNFWSYPLEGSSSYRLEKINKFKAADTDIYLVCNSIQNSAGIHLPETTDIIIFHELEDKYDTQVIGRAQRIGRTDSLHIHRIINENENSKFE